ncbi:MAG: SurA N-terminal domain-containing protein [Lachnotalea sp.]
MKKNVSKKIAGIAVAVLACSIMVTGCAGSVKSDTAVAVVNGEEIPFGVAKFDAKMQQVTYETYYGSMFGDDMWSQTIGGDMTFGESTLEGILDDLKEMYLVDQHADEYSITLTDEETASIAAAAAQFVADNTQDALDSMGANEDIINQYLTKYTIKDKVENVIKAGADTVVSDEDAAQKTFSYVLVSTSGTTDADGNTVELTEEELAAKKAEAQAIVDAATASGDFETAVTDAGLTVSSASYGKDDDAGMDAAVITAADVLEEGDTSPVVETDAGYYVLNLVSAFDAEQTESRRAEIISDRQDTLYNDTYTTWKDAAEITVDEKVWGKVTFEDKLSMVDTTSAEDTTTDATTDTTTDATTDTTTDTTATDATTPEGEVAPAN